MSVEGDIVTTRGVGRPLKFPDPVAFDKAVDSYFEQAQEKGIIPTITGMAVYLDTSRRTLLDYKEKDEFTHSITKALDRCEATLETMALSNKANVAMAIFSLKNNYGWVDKQEVDQNIKMPTPIIGGMAKQVESDVSTDDDD